MKLHSLALIMIVIISCAFLPIGVQAATITWTTNTSTFAITTAYVGDIVKYNYNTVDSGIDALYALTLYKQNDQTGVWVWIETPSHYDTQIGNTTSPTYTVAGAGKAFEGVTWAGYGWTTVAEGYYRINVVEANGGGIIQNVTGTSAILHVSKNPLLLTNFGAWVDDFGGDGMRYAAAVIIILILLCLPYLITRNFSLYLEMMMVVAGIGISYAIGLLDLWVVFGLAIGIFALFILIWRSGSGGGGNPS
jgi:hypothetical protein